MTRAATAFPPTPLVVLLIGIQAPIVLLLAAGVAFWWVDAFAHFLPWLVLGLLSQAALFRRRLLRVFSLAAAAVLVGLMMTAPTAEMAGRPAARCDGPRFRVLSFNVAIGRQDAVALAPLLDEQRPDLAFFMEVTPEWDAVLRQAAAVRGLAYRSDPEPTFYGSALMSRLPLDDVAFVRHEGGITHRRPVLDASDLARQPAGAPQLRAVVRLGEESFVLGGAHLSFPLKPSTHARALRETDQIAAWAQQQMDDTAQAGLLLVGDFNSTPFSAILRRLKAATGLVTAVPLWPGTWPSGLPFGIAIDHVFAAGRLHAVAVEVGGNSGSDHKPVMASVMLEPRACPGG